VPLYDFQADVQGRGFQAWAEPNVFNLIEVMPTGGGKTVLMGDTIQKFNTATCAIAHRQELVSQISLALNRENIPHAIHAPKPVIQAILKVHHETHGYSRYSYRSDIRVAGVDSLRDFESKDGWLSRVGLVVQDEGHHVLRANKWGKAMALFPNARGLLLTAHALRADGCGLGRTGSGVADRLILGPSCRDLINRGFLTDYETYCPSNDLDFSGVQVSRETGEYIQPQLRAATHKSKQLVDDVVKWYLNVAGGKLGVTFAVDIDEAKKMAAAYNKAGVPAEIITSKTPITVRSKFMRLFRARRLLQLVSVDCLGEGVDVPAIEVVSMARRTASFQVYAQQLGRALRIMVEDAQARAWSSYGDGERLACIAASRKRKAIIIDHVGNTAYFAQYHGPPCSRQFYDLNDHDGPARRPLDSLRPCIGCAKPYERYRIECPYCGHVPEMVQRSTPDQVEGDLVLLDPKVLESMRQNVTSFDTAPNVSNYSPAVATFQLAIHGKKMSGQASLRHAMLLWGGWCNSQINDDRVMFKKFYATFGIDVLGAQTLGVADAGALEQRIRTDLLSHGVANAN
jgi:DNA repair protein RadD